MWKKLRLRRGKSNVPSSIVMHTLTGYYRSTRFIGSRRGKSLQRDEIPFKLSPPQEYDFSRRSRIIRCWTKFVRKPHGFRRQVGITPNEDEDEEDQETLNRFNKKSFCTFFHFLPLAHPHQVNSSASVLTIKADESIKNILKYRMKNDSENFSSFFFSGWKRTLGSRQRTFAYKYWQRKKISILRRAFLLACVRGVGEQIIGWWRDLSANP